MRARLAAFVTRRRSLAAAATVVAVALLGTLAIPGLARRVANPSPPGPSFTGTVTGGTFRVKSRAFDLSQMDPKITLTGTVAGNGDWFVPRSGMNIPPMYIEGTPIGTVTVRIQSTHDATGSINPLTGVSNLRFRFRVKLEGSGLGDNCYIGSTGNPIDLNTLITGTTSPPGPNGPISGRPYDPATGGMEIVNNSFSVPEATNCGLFTTGPINDELGLPSAAGNNEARFVMSFNPKIQRAITASYTASPGNGGFAPSTVDFDASGSSAVAGIRDYRWDFDGNGTFDRTTTTPTTSFTYTAPGTYQTRLRVTDSENDFHDTSRTVTIAGRPDAAISKSHSGDFRVGANGTYNLSVSNTGAGPTTGPTTVTDTLPTGLSYVSASGSGWSCQNAGQQVTCTRAASVSAGTTAPAIALQVAVGAGARPAVTNTASVSTPNDTNAANDSASDPTTVTHIDLSIDKRHDRSFRRDRTPNGVYTLAVTNEGTAATVGPTTVTDVLPSGLTYRDFSGTGWSCSAAGQTVTCTHAGAIASGANAAEITLEVNIEPLAPSSVTNTASVATADDTDPENDTDSDPTVIVVARDLAIDKHHSEDFRVGTNGIYTLSVLNDGPMPTAGQDTVTDTLPAGLTYVSATGDGWSCQAVGQDVTCTHATPIPGDTSAGDITLEVAVAEAAGPSVTNSASVAAAGDEDPANNTDSDPTRVKATDVAITKTSSGAFRVDRNGAYALSVANVGSASTDGPTTVTDTLPSGLTYVSASGTGWSCGAAGQNVTCTHSDQIAAGETSDIELVVAVGAGAAPSVTNTASVSTRDDIRSENDSDSDTTPVFDVDLTVTKTHAGSFVAGANGTYTLAVQNVGTRPTTGTTTVTDTLPTGLDYVSGSGAGWSCSGSGREVSCVRAASIAAESSAPILTLKVSVHEAAFPEVTNTASVSTAGDPDPDRNTANDTDSDLTTVLANDLAIVKTHSGSFRVGSTGTYTLGVVNVGSAATNSATTVTDTLPAGLTYVDASGSGWSCSATGQDVTCARSGGIAAGAAAPAIALDVQVGSAAVPGVTNAASVSTANDPNAQNDSTADPTDVTQVDLTLSKSHSGGFRVGDRGTYTLSVDNIGTAATVGTTTIVDTLPAGLTYAGASGSGWSCSADRQVVRCARAAAIAPGQTAPEVTLDVEVGPEALPGVTNTARVITRDDGDPSNDSDDDATGVTADPANSEIEIHPPAGAADALRAGSTGRYVVSVRNIGALDSSGSSTVRVDLPEGLSYGAASGAGWSCSAAGQRVTCTRPDGLRAGARSDIALEVDVSRNAPASVTTVATVSTSGDADETNNSDSDTRPVRRIDLALSKSHVGNFQEGSTGSYRLSVRNTGSAATDGRTTVTDTLPNGLTYVSGTGSAWSCSASGQVVKCDFRERIAPGAAAPDIELKVLPGSSSVPGVTNTAVVATADDAAAGNDTASDRTVVERPRRVSRVTIATGTVRLSSRGEAPVRLSCAAGAGRCAGTLVLQTAQKVRSGRRGRARIVRLGSRSFNVRAGRSMVVRVRLSASGRALVKRAKKLSTRASATLRQPKNAEPASGVLTLAPARASRGSGRTGR